MATPTTLAPVLSFYDVGPPGTPQAIRRLRRQSYDFCKYIGQSVVVMHRYTNEDFDAGIAKHCPACFDGIYEASRNDCLICFGVGFVSVEDDPTDFIDLVGRDRVTSDPGTGVKAPFYGGYSQPYITYLVEPDRPVDQMQWSSAGVLVRTKQAQGFAPWTPLLVDNDLCINVTLDGNSNILNATDRFLLKQVEPATIRGQGQFENYTPYTISQTFEMARVPNEDPQILYQVPFRKKVHGIDIGTVTARFIGAGIEVRAIQETGIVSVVSEIVTNELYAINDFATILCISQPSGVDVNLYSSEAATVTCVSDETASTDIAIFPDLATVTGTSVISAGDVFQGLQIDAATVTGISVISTAETAQYIDATTETGVSVISAVEVFTPIIETTPVTGVSAPSAVDVGVFPELPTVVGLPIFSALDAVDWNPDSATVFGAAIPSALDGKAWTDSATIMGTFAANLETSTQLLSGTNIYPIDDIRIAELQASPSQQTSINTLLDPNADRLSAIDSATILVDVSDNIGGVDREVVAFGGGYAQTAAVDPTDSATMLVGSDVFGTWRTINAGDLFFPVNLGLTAVPDRQIATIVWNAAVTGQVMRVSKQNVWESVDHGVTWTNLGGTGLTGGGSHPRGTGRAATYLDDGSRVTLFDQSSVGVQIAPAGASPTWTVVNGYPGGAPQGLVANPANRKQVMIVDSSHCWRVPDITAGTPTWTAITGLAGAYELVYDAVNDQMIAGQGQTIKALPNPWGASASTAWTTLYTGDTNFGGVDVLTNSGTTYIIAGGNPYNTTGVQAIIRGRSSTGFISDTGTWDSPLTNDLLIDGLFNITWALPNADSTDAINGSSVSYDTVLLIVHPTTGKVVAFAIGRAGAWRCDDFSVATGSILWHPMVNGLGGGIDRDVAWDPRDNGALTVGLSDHGVLWTSNISQFNDQKILQKMSDDAQSIVYDPITNEVIVGFDSGKIISFSDPTLGSTTVTTLATPGGGNNICAIGLIYNLSNQRVLLYSEQHQTVQISVNGGAFSTISALGTPSGKQNVFATSHDGTLIAYHWKGTGVYVSADYGATWTQVLSSSSSSDYAGALAWDPRPGNNSLYYTSTTQFRKIVGPWASPTVTDLTGSLPTSMGIHDIGTDGTVIIVIRATIGTVTPQVYSTTVTQLDTGTPNWQFIGDPNNFYANIGTYPLAISVNGQGAAAISFDGAGVVWIPS